MKEKFMKSPIQGDIFNYFQKINNNGRIVIFRQRLQITDAEFYEIQEKEKTKDKENKK